MASTNAPGGFLRARWLFRISRAIVAGLACAALVVLAAPGPASSAASIGSLQSQAAKLEKQISSQGNRIQQIVVGYDEAVSKEETIHAKLLGTQAQLVTDESAQANDANQVRQIAVYDFVDSSNPAPAIDALAPGNLSSVLIEQEYSQVVSDKLQNAIDALQTEERQTNAAEAALRSEQASAQAAVNAISQQGQQAQVALSKETNLLGTVKGNLKALLAAAAQARQAALDAEEQALSALQSQNPVPLAVPILPGASPAPGTYANPLRDIGGLNPERIDQGVDYSGYGPIFAVGDGVVLSTVNAGWPGGTFISYRLTDGPAQGLVVYAGEDILPQVSPGQIVTAGTQIGTMYEGPDGIETGWADPSGDGVSMANDYGQFSGENSSAFGANFSAFMQSIGAPGGVLQNSPPTGSLPPGWPAW
jgi:murein DD-endopeptidase MepM/ murein hydrolase activator NlpD